MLARVSKRRLRNHALLSKQLNSSFQRFHLPRICLTQLRWIAGTPLTTQTPVQDGLRPRPAATAASRKDSRSLATATDPHAPTSESIPFLTNVPLPTPNQFHAVPSFSSIRPWDDFRPLVIHEQIAEPPPHIAKKRGIGGDPTELIQNLHACLGVARWDRAEAIVRRLANIFHPSAPELLEAH